MLVWVVGLQLASKILYLLGISFALPKTCVYLGHVSIDDGCRDGILSDPLPVGCKHPSANQGASHKLWRAAASRRNSTI